MVSAVSNKLVVIGPAGSAAIKAVVRKVSRSTTAHVLPVVVVTVPLILSISLVGETVAVPTLATAGHCVYEKLKIYKSREEELLALWSMYK